MIWPLNPRAVALQGIGFAQRIIALQGLWPTTPYRRGPRGPGYGARPEQGYRPAMAATVRAPYGNTTRAPMAPTVRSTMRNTTRVRR